MQTNKNNKLYLAGPMTGYDDFNIPAFKAAREELAKKGFEIELPYDIDNKVDPTWTWGDYLAKDIQLIVNTCNGMVLLPEWERSRGAKLEVACGLMQSLKHPEFQFHLYHPNTNIIEYTNSFAIAEQWYEYWDEYSKQPGLAA